MKQIFGLVFFVYYCAHVSNKSAVIVYILFWYKFIDQKCNNITKSNAYCHLLISAIHS